MGITKTFNNIPPHANNVRVWELLLFKIKFTKLVNAKY